MGFNDYVFIMNLDYKSIPILPLRDIVVFPNVTTPLFVGREKSINALESEPPSTSSGLFKVRIFASDINNNGILQLGAEADYSDTNYPSFNGILTDIVSEGQYVKVSENNMVKVEELFIRSDRAIEIKNFASLLT